jgi:hypothetical protein
MRHGLLVTIRSARTLKPRLLAAAAGLAVAVAPLAAAPANANPADDAFLAALGAAGIGFENQVVAKTVAHNVCPSLKKGAKSFAWTVSGVVASGVPRQVATTFTGLAVRTYCPEMIKSTIGF